MTEEGKKRYGMSDKSHSKQGSAFERESKKLNKLKDRTNVELQTQKSKEYAKRALKIGAAGGAAIGAGIAGKTPGFIMNPALQKFQDIKDSDYGLTISNISDGGYLTRKFKENGKWKNTTEYVTRDQFFKFKDDYWKKYDDAEANVSRINNATNITKTALTGVGLGLLGVAGYNAVQSVLAKNRTTFDGHDRAVQKYNKQINKMIDMFADTPYEELAKNLKEQKNKS